MGDRGMSLSCSHPPELSQFPRFVLTAFPQPTYYLYASRVRLLLAPALTVMDRADRQNPWRGVHFLDYLLTVCHAFRGDKGYCLTDSDMSRPAAPDG
jgi:hypothetical protein